MLPDVPNADKCAPRDLYSLQFSEGLRATVVAIAQAEGDGYRRLRGEGAGPSADVAPEIRAAIETALKAYAGALRSMAAKPAEGAMTRQ
jgi:hypothetical protein